MKLYEVLVHGSRRYIKFGIYDLWRYMKFGIGLMNLCEMLAYDYEILASYDLWSYMEFLVYDFIKKYARFLYNLWSYMKFGIWFTKLYKFWYMLYEDIWSLV